LAKLGKLVAQIVNIRKFFLFVALRLISGERIAMQFYSVGTAKIRETRESIRFASPIVLGLAY
jgi:hypothetical protein